MFTKVKKKYEAFAHWNWIFHFRPMRDFYYRNKIRYWKKKLIYQNIVKKHKSYLNYVIYNFGLLTLWVADKVIDHRYKVGLFISWWIWIRPHWFHHKDIFI